MATAPIPDQKSIEVGEHFADRRLVLDHATDHSLEECGDEAGLQVVPGHIRHDDEQAFRPEGEDIDQIATGCVLRMPADL